MSSDKSVDITGSVEPAWERAVRKAVRTLRYGSVEVQVHDGPVVQVERDSGGENHPPEVTEK
jgi:hypothetical protein